MSYNQKQQKDTCKSGIIKVSEIYWQMRATPILFGALHKKGYRKHSSTLIITTQKKITHSMLCHVFWCFMYHALQKVVSKFVECFKKLLFHANLIILII